MSDAHAPKCLVIDVTYCNNTPLARQKYWQIRTNFTTLLLYNYNLNLDYKDYSKNLLASLTCLEVL